MGIKKTPSWFEIRIEQAISLSKKIKWDTDSPNAAIIVDENNRPISEGYKGYSSNIPDWKYLPNNRDKNKEVHAEENAIAYAARRGLSTEGGIMILVGAPCIRCARLIEASGIKELVYIPILADDKESSPDGGIEYLHECGVKTTEFKYDIKKAKGEIE